MRGMTKHQTLRRAPKLLVLPAVRRDRHGEQRSGEGRPPWKERKVG
jgi:hypothetical protein